MNYTVQYSDVAIYLLKVVCFAFDLWMQHFPDIAAMSF